MPEKRTELGGNPPAEAEARLLSEKPRPRTSEEEISYLIHNRSSGMRGVVSGRSEVSNELKFDDAKMFEKIRETLVDALGVDDDEVQLESRLENDLGAGSIDLLDIVFRLEKNFGIKIPRGELFTEMKFDRSSEVEDFAVPEELLEALSAGFTHFDPKIMEEFRKEPIRRNIGTLFTVKALADFVKQKIASNPQNYHSEWLL